jgi:hypothetical protein
MKKKNMIKRKALIHLVFWMAYLLPNLLLGYDQYPSKEAFFAYLSSIIGFTIGIFYLMSECLIPLMVSAKGRGRLIWLLLPIVWILASYLNMWMEVALQRHYFDALSDYEPNIGDYMLGVFWLIFISTGVTFGHLWYEHQLNYKEAETLKIRAELDHLRYRVSPHFLFNTLNNLYALALDGSEKTPQVVLQLSNLMRYMLQNEQDQVLLADEIAYLENYLALEKIRLGEHVKITMNVHGVIKYKKIAPMILLPFVENSFKHGLNSSAFPGYVEIELQVTGNKFFFYIENSKKNASDGKLKTGVGLPNVRRRLDLIYGKNSYELEITNTVNKYMVNLYLELNSI